MAQKKLPIIGMLAFFLAQSVLPFNSVVNYSSVLTVNDFAVDGNVLWAASSGGLYRYDCISKTGTLFSDPSLFLDLNLTCLCLDANHTLWIGTKKGYLYQKPSLGHDTVLTSYETAGWQLTKIVSYGKYLIIGSPQGCSVFDKSRLTAVKNATAFGTAAVNSQVSTLAVYHDTLLLGCGQGVAKLYIGGAKLDAANFSDPTIWTIDSTIPHPVQTFIVRPDSYQALQTPAALLNGRIISGVPVGIGDTAKTDLVIDGVRALTIPSAITALMSDTNFGRRQCLIGTTLNYFYVWDGTDTINVPIDGPTFTAATRVYVDREGLVWVCTNHKSVFKDNPWWEGISVFKNGRWKVYSPGTIPSMTTIGNGTSFKGISEDPQGRMWFGPAQVGPLRWDRGTDSWQRFCTGAYSDGRGQFFAEVPPATCYHWAESNAIAADSAGFLWFSPYLTYDGSLLCYSPQYNPDVNGSSSEERHYRYFFPQGDVNYSDFYGCFCVDGHNNIIVGEQNGLAGGRILVLTYHGSPLTNGVQVRNIFPNNGNVYDAVTAPGGLTYLATQNGLGTFVPDADALMPGLWARNGDNGSISLVDSTVKGVQAIKAEDDRYLWLGTSDRGVIRYDLGTGGKTEITATNGLLSNVVWDLSIDRKNGYLWIASDAGVSRYALGYSLTPGSSTAALVFPNPYSKRRHLDLAFQNLPAGCAVAVYTIAGNLVKVLHPFVNGNLGSGCIWQSPDIDKVRPGIYLYTVQSIAKSSSGKIIITP